MESCNILYYCWNEYTHKDAIQVLKELGHHVYISQNVFNKYDNDDVFMENIQDSIRENHIDLLFSFNYFPDLSRVANIVNIPYISWVFDSPHRTLDSVTLGNNCNHVYLFDFLLFEKYQMQGFSTVHHMPLACNVPRLEKQLESFYSVVPRPYQHDISFLGTLYNDEFNFFDQIKYLPPYIRGYIDAAMESQKQLYGMDMISPLLNDSICQEILKYINLDMSDNYRKCQKELLVSMLQKNITVKERTNLLTVLGEHYALDHYAGQSSSYLPVNYKGYADYYEEMPFIFATSKINLNITLRSILSGIPLRVIDILGAGGFCITNYQAELSNYFINNESIVWYEDYKDLFEKVHYYLNHDKEREMIAQKGHEIIRDNFSYQALLPKILAI